MDVTEQLTLKGGLIMSPRSREEYIEVTFLRYKNAPRKRKSAPHRFFLSRESPHHHIRPSGGYPFCGSSRYAVFTKSPQTGIYSESYSGGGRSPSPSAVQGMTPSSLKGNRIIPSFSRSATKTHLTRSGPCERPAIPAGSR